MASAKSGLSLHTERLNPGLNAHAQLGASGLSAGVECFFRLCQGDRRTWSSVSHVELPKELLRLLPSQPSPPIADLATQANSVREVTVDQPRQRSRLQCQGTAGASTGHRAQYD